MPVPVPKARRVRRDWEGIHVRDDQVMEVREERKGGIGKPVKAQPKDTNSKQNLDDLGRWRGWDTFPLQVYLSKEGLASPAGIEITCNVIQRRLSDFLILPQPVHLLHVFVFTSHLVQTKTTLFAEPCISALYGVIPIW